MDLVVYQKAYLFTLDIYKITKNFPKEEIFGITSQMRRAAASIPVNIAEGSTRTSKKEYQQFAVVALGSATEMDVWLQLSKDLGYLTETDYTPLKGECDEICRMLSGLIKSIKAQI